VRRRRRRRQAARLGRLGDAPPQARRLAAQQARVQHLCYIHLGRRVRGAPAAAAGAAAAALLAILAA
jgi:hypothetical protein